MTAILFCFALRSNHQMMCLSTIKSSKPQWQGTTRGVQCADANNIWD